VTVEILDTIVALEPEKTPTAKYGILRQMSFRLRVFHATDKTFGPIKSEFEKK
jgi:hypothetical protein